MAAAWMLMPKAAVNLDSHLVSWQHDIRRTRKVSPVQSEPESKSMQALPNANLGLGMGFADGAHRARSGGRDRNVGH